jgi:hypothetical protein
MDGLLARVLEAHGGLENWDRVTGLTGSSHSAGPSGSCAAGPDVYADQTVTVETYREHITFAPFTAPDRMSVIDVDPDRVIIRTGDGPDWYAESLARERAREELPT